MRRSLKVGSIAGIGIYLHWTFLLLIAAIFGFYYVQSQSLGAALSGMGLIVGVFGCVVLHELGHALTARRFGVGTRSITLSPIGGLARLERIPSEPMKEFWIAIGGPVVNVAIAVVLGAVLLVVDGSFSPDVLRAPGSHTLASLSRGRSPTVTVARPPSSVTPTDAFGDERAARIASTTAGPSPPSRSTAPSITICGVYSRSGHEAL